MINYIIKTILCSAVLILIYYLILEKEKTFHFNRFYLLLSVVFSFIIPLITIKIRSTSTLITEITEPFFLPNADIQNISTQQPILLPIEDKISIADILLVVYLLVTIFLLCRFIINLYIIFRKVKKNDSIPYSNIKLVFTDDRRVPHSFLKYLFIREGK